MKYWGLPAVWRPLSFALAFGIAAVFFGWPLWLATAISLIDAHARWHEYEEVFEHSFSRRLAIVLRGSWCRRGVAEAAWPEAKELYRSKGYQWYSVFPDGAPMIFIRFRFWEVVFGFRGGRMRGKTPRYIVVLQNVANKLIGNSSK